MSFVQITSLLWLAAWLLQVGIGTAMVWRRSFRIFPSFFAYTVFHLLRAAVLFVVFRLHLAHPYFYAYWGAEILDAAISFFVIRELFGRVFATLPGLKRLGQMLTQWAAGALVTMATVSAALMTASETNRAITAIISFGHGVAFVKAGLIFLLFAFCSAFSVPIRRYATGIAIGIALFASVDFVVWAARGYLGTELNQVLSLLRSWMYNASLVVWMVYLLQREPVLDPRKPAGAHLSAWNAALARVLQA
jgi:hypothetical protein